MTIIVVIVMIVVMVMMVKMMVTIRRDNFLPNWSFLLWAIFQVMVSPQSKDNRQYFVQMSKYFCVFRKFGKTLLQTIDSVLCRKNSGHAASVIELITITLCRTIAIKLI